MRNTNLAGEARTIGALSLTETKHDVYPEDAMLPLGSYNFLKSSYLFSVREMCCSLEM